ncbi:MAG: hypothetical protein AAFP82_20930, partial [Bacteroidota bacterium]
MKLRLLLLLWVTLLGACQTEQVEEKSHQFDHDFFAQEISLYGNITQNWNTLGIEDSIIVLQNEDKRIPFQNLLDQSFYLLHFGENNNGIFNTE